MGRSCRMQLIDLALEEGLFLFFFPVETALLVPTFLALALWHCPGIWQVKKPALVWWTSEIAVPGI